MPISTAVFAFCVACLTSILVTPMVRRLAVRMRWRDLPRDAEHKERRSVRTHAGGIAIVLSLVTAVACVDPSFGEVAPRIRGDLLFVLPGALLAAGIGLVDDLRGCRPIEKLIVQIAGAAVVVTAVVSLPAGWMHDGLAVPTTVIAGLMGLWIVGTTNAVNLVDGIDGLAPGLALLNALGLTVLAVLEGQIGVGVLAAATAGCATGFLRSNRHPAKIYLGDSGSMFLGFVLGSLGVVLIARSSGPAVVGAVVLMGWVPVLDTTLAIVRRLRSGVSPFRPDRDHVHHRLVSHGVPVRRAATILWGVGLVATAAALVVAAGLPIAPALGAVALVTLPLARVVLPLKVTARVDDPRRESAASPDRVPEPALGAAQNRAA